METEDEIEFLHFTAKTLSLRFSNEGWGNSRITGSGECGLFLSSADELFRKACSKAIFQIVPKSKFYQQANDLLRFYPNPIPDEDTMERCWYRFLGVIRRHKDSLDVTFLFKDQEFDKLFSVVSQAVDFGARGGSLHFDLTIRFGNRFFDDEEFGGPTRSDFLTGKTIVLSKDDPFACYYSRQGAAE